MVGIVFRLIKSESFGCGYSAPRLSHKEKTQARHTRHNSIVSLYKMQVFRPLGGEGFERDTGKKSEGKRYERLEHPRKDENKEEKKNKRKKKAVAGSDRLKLGPFHIKSVGKKCCNDFGTVERRDGDEV